MRLIRAGNHIVRIFQQSKILGILDKHMYIVLLIPLFLIAYDLSKPGITIAGDFPYFDTPDYASSRMWLWVDKGSIDGFEFVTRLPIIGLMYVLSYVNLNSELASKAMILAGFLLSSFTFYFSYLLFFKDRLDGHRIFLKISGILGSLFYAYNVWSFNRIHHYYLWIGYSLLPLFFISVFLYFKNPKDWKYLVLAIFTWSIASSTPHMTLFYGIILVSMILGFIIYRLYKNKARLAVLSGISFLVIVSCYLAVNFYWLYPYFLASGSQALTPNYELTGDSIQLLSRESNFFNTFRILAYWLNTDVTIPEHSLSFYLWLSASMAIPITAFSALLLRSSVKYALIFSSMGLIGILLAMGTYSPIDYYKLVLSVPVLTKFVWILRDSDKLTFLITFAYSFLMGMVSFAIFSTVSRAESKERNKLLLSCIILGLFTSLIIGSIFLVSFPFYEVRTAALAPVKLPSEFDRLNGYLSTTDTDRVYFMPYPMYETSWNNKSRVNDVYQTHSIKPSIESSEYNYAALNYYNYLQNSIIQNYSKSIGNLIHPLGTSYIIFHNDTWNKIRDTYDKNNIELLKKLYFINDIKNVENIGFYKIFKVTNEDKDINVGQVFIPSQNIAVLSDLGTLASLNSLTTFDSLQSSIRFLDDAQVKQAGLSSNIFNQLILHRPSTLDEIAVSFADNKRIITPFDATYRYEPAEVWSKSRVRDPTHAEFHPFINNLGIDNWDSDYGRGIVMTSAFGAKISIPVNINFNNNADNEQFKLFMRYLKNEKGGQIKVYLDNKLVSTVDTLDRISSNFVWDMVNPSVNLTNGKHTLTLENVVGFNAVNILTLITTDELSKIRTEISHLLADKNIIYLLEAESNFYDIQGADTSYKYRLFDNNDTSNVNRVSNQTLTETFAGQFQVPENSDLAVLQFSSKRSPNTQSDYLVKSLEINPAYKKHNVFSSDFEMNKMSVPLAILRHSYWINYDKDLVSTSLEESSPLYGNHSLHVDIKSGDKIGWNVLSTDIIPIKDDAIYKAALDLSAKDVKHLHARALFYDSDQYEMTGATALVFNGRDGTFNGTFTSGILPPKDAKYLKFQVVTLSANPKPSSYILDNVSLDEITEPYTFSTIDSGPSTEGALTGPNQILFDESLKNNSTDIVIQTKPLALSENHVYNYTITTESKNVRSNLGTVLFKRSDDVVRNFTKYGNNASNGGVTSLKGESEISTVLNIFKSANYTTAIRANTCLTCTLKLEIVGNGEVKNNVVSPMGNVSLDENSSGFFWKYATTYLRQGKYDLNIRSNASADIDAVAIFMDGNDVGNKSVSKNDNEKLDLFNSGKNISQPYIAEYKKINPTKHIVYVKNATAPYMLAFAESYDPLWTAYAEKNIQNNASFGMKSNSKVNSVPLYGVINGFAVNKTGDYTMVIEYEPQKWFTLGATVSIIAIIIITIGILFFTKREILTKIRRALIHQK